MLEKLVTQLLQLELKLTDSRLGLLDAKCVFLYFFRGCSIRTQKMQTWRTLSFSLTVLLLLTLSHEGDKCSSEGEKSNAIDSYFAKISNKSANNEQPTEVPSERKLIIMKTTGKEVVLRLSKLEGNKANVPDGNGNAILQNCTGTPSLSLKLLDKTVINETLGYHADFLCPRKLLEMPVRKPKAYFSSRKISSTFYFLDIWNILYFRKTLKKITR